MPTDLLGDPLPEVRDWDAPKVPDSKRQTFGQQGSIDAIAYR